MKICFFRNKKEEIFFIFSEYEKIKTLLITNSFFPFVGFNLLRKTKENLFIHFTNEITLELIINQLEEYDNIIISGLLPNDFQIAFIKKYLITKNKNVFLFLCTEENKILNFEECIKCYIT